MTGEEFNVNSPKQMADVLFVKMGLKYQGMRKTSTGVYSTKEEVLQKLAEEHVVAVKILEYRELQKLLSKLIAKLKISAHVVYTQCWRRFSKILVLTQQI